jgi:hypothetical protein
MSTKPAGPVKLFPEDSVEKKTYNLVESLKEYLPINNDRNRLAYGLFKYLNGEGDSPNVLLKSTKVQIQGISLTELADKISDALKNIK